MQITFCPWMLVFASSMLLSGCNYYGDIYAPNDWTIGCDKGRNCIAVKGHNVLVGPEIDKYDIQGQYLIGHTVVQDNSWLGSSSVPAPPMGTEKAGYFVLDTGNDSATTGLSESEWRSLLGSKGITTFELKDTPYQLHPRNR